MCNKDLLLEYLYDELPASDRLNVDRHLASCADCREEVNGLRGTRTHLASWAPPEPDLGFHVIRGAARVAPPARWWGRSPAWGLAAAAVITLAVSAAIANVEVRAGSDGIVVRTGWNRATTAEPVVLSNGVAPSEMARVEARVQELESRLSTRQGGVVAASASVSRMSDAEIVRLVRQQVSESEQRQRGDLAHRILQVSRDVEVARRSDVDRLLTALRQQQGTIYDTSQRQKALEDHFMRVGLQR
jgi:hypothetical protein